MTGSRLHFLVFAPRSGSTVVARALSEAYPTLLVLPEFRTMEFLLARSEPAVRRLTSKALARILLADRQLHTNLAIGPEAAVAFADRHAGQSTHEIVAGLVRAYTGADATPQDVIIKLSTAAAYLARLRTISPEGVIIDVCRDGRAAVSSLLTTERAYFRNETMGRGDVVHCCRVWARHQQVLRRAVHDGYPLVRVRYEEFVETPQRVCQEIGSRLGIDVAVTAAAGSTMTFAVSAHEQVIHPLAGTPPATVRREAWREELPRRSQVFAEWRLHHELLRLGYSDPLDPAAGRRELVACIARGYGRHVLALTRYLANRSTTVVRRPGDVLEHLHARLALSSARWKHTS